MQWQTLERLSKITPFNDPNILKHILDNQDAWFAYANAKDGDNVAMPGPYLEYDPVKRERLLRKIKKQQEDAEKAAKKRGSQMTAKLHMVREIVVEDDD